MVYIYIYIYIYIYTTDGLAILLHAEMEHPSALNIDIKN